MATRLDRLVLLLDTGSTHSVRQTAAQQLGQVQKENPQKLYYLLARILVHLRSKTWETRIAAGLAIDAIAKNVPQWDPSTTEADSASKPSDDHHLDDLLSFSSFDIDVVLKNGAPLLSSAGTEFDFDYSKLDPKERIALQKKQLRERLGLGTEFMDVDFFTEADMASSAPNTDKSSKKQQAQLIIENSIKARAKASTPSIKDEGAPEDEINMEGLSARERNRLKRKAKLAAKDKSKEVVRMTDLSSSSSMKRRKLNDTCAGDSAASPVGAKVKIESDADSSSLGLDPNAHVVEHKSNSDASAIDGSVDEWPFEGLCEQLLLDLFSPTWEVRHGAAIGLREIIKNHGSGAGKLVGLSEAINAQRHLNWLEDVACRLLCVLALDRFADFISDQIVTPVRETCAQTLGALLRWCDNETCLKVLNQGLLKLIEGSTNLADVDTASATDRPKGSRGGGRWEVRHAGLIGLKYWMALRKDLVGNVIVSSEEGVDSGVFTAIINGLKDSDDDVRAVSSSALLPITDLLIELLPIPRIFDSIILTLWDCLLDLDDLTSATGFVMDLLSQLIQMPKVSAYIQSTPSFSLSKLVPRLYRFFRHAITSVRIAVLKTVMTLLEMNLAILRRAEPDLTLGSESSWIKIELFRLLFQNFLIEERPEIINLTLSTWERLWDLNDALYSKSSKPDAVAGIDVPFQFLPSWLGLIMTPMGTAFDTNAFFYVPTDATLSLTRRGAGAKTSVTTDSQIAVHDKVMVNQDLTVISIDDIIRGRLASSKALGVMIHSLIQHGTDTIHGRVKELLTSYLNSGWATHRIFANVVAEEWAGRWECVHPPPCTIDPQGHFMVDAVPLAGQLWDVMTNILIAADSGAVVTFYRELNSPLNRVFHESQTLLSTFTDAGVQGVPPLPPLPFSPVETGRPTSLFGPQFNILVAQQIAGEVYDQFFQLVGPAGRNELGAVIAERRARLNYAIENYNEVQRKWEVRVHACMSSASVRLGRLPPKINPVIRSLMNAIKFETNEQIQKRSAEGVSRMIQMNVALQRPAAINDKVVKNLAGFLCSDTDVVWDIRSILEEPTGIWTLRRLETSKKEANPTPSKIHAADKPKSSGGRKKTAATGSSDDSGAVLADAAAALPANMSPEDAARKARQIVRRGAEIAVSDICLRFQDRVFDDVPKLWEVASKALLEFKNQSDPSATDVSPLHRLKESEDFTQEVIDGLYISAVLAPHIHQHYYPMFETLLSPICTCLHAESALVRNMASRTLGALAKTLTVDTMHAIISQVIPLLSDSINTHYRQGAAEAIFHIVQDLDVTILSYIIFLIVPILGRMSDPDESVRFISTNIFAQLVKLIPLESGVPDPPGFSQELIKQKTEERRFLGQLVGTERMESFELPVVIKADLRPYQKEGVNWLAFLNRYQLHGILCDDMGLGKTLQTICILASDHHIRSEKHTKSPSLDTRHCPSLIVCPPTLTGHWYHEILQFAPFLRSMIYTGGPADRQRLRGQFLKHDAIVMSYDILRNDIDEINVFHWNYCILDEGHVIKNGKTKLTKAVKTIKAMKRLILSGTPIQNNVLELWSLFDFLMPGFLGTERQFNERFGKPILASRDAKSSSREQEAGALAMEALHRQALPFLLRRMKENVLDDLPPKIIQDYYCELSPLQKVLYEEFAQSHTKNEIETDIAGPLGAPGGSGAKTETKEKGQHIFQALQYLRKLCNHPALVLNPSHPKYKAIMAADPSAARDVKNAPKLEALKQILLDCGIGDSSGGEPGAEAATTTTAPHRALIFVQLRPMLDIIENDLFKQMMPSVTYMRLDGTTDALKRHSIVKTFNEDPSIDVLLLTTHVGGLGLNLTGADTVIFVEHDWNPMKDLQAMDRAHRIGQKRVVNVYRLITRGTLEEKIMGLQKFKLNIASSVINQDNSGLRSMDTDQILDLFSLDGGAGGDVGGGGALDQGRGAKKKEGKMTAKEIVEGLENLWDEKQYEDLELDEFLKNLK
ncbi:uncharacterized protein BJ171DRAFT_487176 [Polychytrium aggregatum]|uniref:uncharacterized protein n=1 Tax=Polychytrium aggregatum TaxID=110093 RepID=UPI0022FE8425|nr:uncharacterized protein BJ171DRAFT_487176 [Polychytrium aggregatum]KAI9209494.1 hypothetical protein BJ171DRAFT_487176 [Polychytrium aggregatum]